MAEHLLSNGAVRIDFQTDPARYKHWKLAVDGDIATLTLDVDENGGLFEGYQLKLNSYDLGVDIELADAVRRLRFEHPSVKSIVLRSGKNRVFCAGANIRMLAGATHAHKVNFCKFTNETRNALEDASEHSGLRSVCAINGAAAGGGYELALAADEIMLVDDGSSTVALPEVPLLAVLPGTGGLTRVTDKRKVRRDLADVFSTIEEGIKGKRAVQWRLVDELVSQSKLESRAARARARTRVESETRRHRRGDQTDAPAAQGRPTTRCEYEYVEATIDRAQRVGHHYADMVPIKLRPASRRHVKAKARLSGRCSLRANSMTPSFICATMSMKSARWCSNRWATATWCLPTTRFSTRTRPIGSSHEIRQLWKCVLKRIDVTSRSLVALIEPGSCFAGTLGRNRVCLRPLLHADRPVRGRQPSAGDNLAVPAAISAPIR